MALQQFWETHKKGSFHADLGVRAGEIIPIDLLLRLKDAYVGERIFNPYAITPSKKFINVTPLMKKKAQFLINMRRGR